MRLSKVTNKTLATQLLIFKKSL